MDMSFPQTSTDNLVVLSLTSQDVAPNANIQHESVGGIVVSIAAFQAVDPGSIPGRRNVFLKPSFVSNVWSNVKLYINEKDASVAQ